MRLNGSYHSAYGQPEEKGMNESNMMSEGSSFIAYRIALHFHRSALKG